MTPNPNPSPELRDLIDMLGAATLEDGVRVYEHEAEEIGIATMNARADLLAALTPPPTPAETVTVALPGPIPAAAQRLARMMGCEFVPHSTSADIAPVALPGAGEGENLRARLVAAEHAALKWEQACQQSWDREALATVAAANDEGVAEQVSRLRDAYDAVAYWPERRGDPMTVGGAGFIDLLKLRNLVAELLDDPDAIRLLSPGGGK